MLRGHRETVTGPGVDLDNFPTQFVVLLKDQPSVVGGVFKLGNNHPEKLNPKTIKHMAKKIMRQRTFLWCPVEKHPNDRPHVVFHLDDEDLLFVPDEHSTAAVCGKNPSHFNGDHVITHQRSR